MVGGQGVEYSTEVMLQDGCTCTMQDLKVTGRELHSATGLTVCGGDDYQKEAGRTCSTFNGEWEISHHLRFSREGHVSWLSPDGPILMGGILNETHTQPRAELLSSNSNTTTLLFHVSHDVA